MKLLYGISPPVGEGIILEVHLDIQETDQSFISWLESVGFENDPFLIFHPPQYTHHMTGRTRCLSKDLHTILPGVHALVESVIAEAHAQGFNLYTEIELARETVHFSRRESLDINNVLDLMDFRQSGLYGGAKADVHVEFENGTVPEAVREYLLDKKFYWVSTPQTQNFPSEEIATLQTTTYQGGKKIFELLVANPLPFCTGIHLEQKLSMKTTDPKLPMPEVIEVVY